MISTIGILKKLGLTKKTDFIAPNEKVYAQDIRVISLKEKLKSVEPYQPTYGLTGLVDYPERGTKDRCEAIFEYFENKVHGLRMLDVGSSLGFVTLYFADRGAKMEGWDYDFKNIGISEAISEINNIKNVSFALRTFNKESIEAIEANYYDAIIVLNVFHHDIASQGLEQVKSNIKSIFEKTSVLVTELAQKGEDTRLYWDAAQPEDSLEIFDLVKDEVEITLLGEFTTHLSAKKRPLYAISKKNVRVNDKIYGVTKSSIRAYNESIVSGFERRYFHTEEYVIKEYGLLEKPSRSENSQIFNELALVRDLKQIEHVSRIVDFEILPHLVRIVYERIEGKLLSDTVVAKIKDKDSLLYSLLNILVELEKKGINHNDIRPWNVLIDKNGDPNLIDFGLAHKGTQSFNYNASSFFQVASFIHNSRMMGLDFASPYELYGKEPDLSTLPKDSPFYELLREYKEKKYKSFFELQTALQSKK